jgi:hypothetical protein
MKRHLLIAMVWLAVVLFALSQFGCTNTPDNQGTSTNMATPEATPDTAAIEKALVRIENDWPRVMKERDGKAVRRVDADDVYLLSWDGSVATKEEDAKFIESGSISADKIEMSDLKVKVLDKDAAVVTGMITIGGAKYKAPNKCLDVNGPYRFVDTFARRDGEWKLVASGSVKIMGSPSPEASPAMKASPSPTMSAAPVVRASPAAKPSPRARPSPAKVAPAASPVKMKTP